MPLLSIITFLPVLGAFFIFLTNKEQKKKLQFIFVITIILQIICLCMILKKVFSTDMAAISAHGSQLYMAENICWLQLPLGNLGTLAINYFLGLDGLNLGLLLMAMCILLMSGIASLSIRRYFKAYVICYLLLNSCIVGSLLALDALLFYIFFELALLPICCFIGLWGEDKIKGPKIAIHFFLYTLLGALLIFIVIIGLGLSAYDPIATGVAAGIYPKGTTLTADQITQVIDWVQNKQIASQHIVHTLDLLALTKSKYFLPESIFGLLPEKYIGHYAIRLLGFLVLLVGFLIKLAAVPLHSWLPPAHVQAPTPISMILAGIMLKLGAYGLIRLGYSIFPEGGIVYATHIAILGIISLLYAAFNALVIKDLKKIIAYASISHMGFFLLGISTVTTTGLQGAYYQLISHGLLATMLFGVVDVLYCRTQDRCLMHYGGLTKCMPHYTVIAMMAFCAAMGIPGFSSFIAELLVLLGVFKSAAYKGTYYAFILGGLGMLGVFFQAVYFVRIIQQLFGGELKLAYDTYSEKMKDLTTGEYIFLLTFIILMVIIGIFPNLIWQLSYEKLASLLEQLWSINA